MRAEAIPRVVEKQSTRCTGGDRGSGRRVGSMQFVSTPRAFVMSRAFAALLVAATAGGCWEQQLPPSIWPPADFACTVEELAMRDGRPEVVRRVRFAATGVVAYGTTTRSVVDPGAEVVLPVFDRLAVYQLVPDCLRTFARRLDRLGISTLDTVQGERSDRAEGGLVLRWRAFGAERVITARGRMHGAMAQILAVVNAHLPPGERLGGAVGRRRRGAGAARRAGAQQRRRGGARGAPCVAGASR